jgi:hypothetical protein
MMTKRRRDDGYVIVFRRWRRDRNGKVYDVRAYGLRAWPMRVRRRWGRR